MLKSLFAVLALTFTLGATAVASANPAVRRDFLPDGLGFTENPEVEGRVRFRFNECTQETTIRLNIDGLVPGQTYGVLWLSDGPALDNPAAFTADAEGEGRYVDFQIGDASGDPVVIIYIDDPLSGTPGLYDLGEDRAFSYLPFTRIRVFEPAGLCTLENPCVEGMATIRYETDLGATSVRLNIKDLRPNTTYGVKFEAEVGAGFDNPAAFTTNHRGNGKFFDDGTIGVSTLNVVITIYRNNDPMGDPFGFDLSEVRAVGDSANDEGCD
ncbi:MAG: hypothetical protein AB7K52_09075 [Phycisphaerales bacterium]